MPERKLLDRRYMPGLDGLRAISVLAVIAYHFNLQLAPGGLLGVGIFFVLSGYLITDQLMSEWQDNRKIDLAHFWTRRARRLLPAMFSMLALTAVWLLLFDPSRLASIRGDFASAVLYFNNWWLIFHKVSYFESFGPPSPIGHLWSLAIEEQFYLLWPLLLAIGMRFAARRGKLILFMLGGAALSALAMGLLYVPGLDPSRVYYGTDTRVFALLIGAALAVAWPSRKLADGVKRGSRAMMDLIGTVCLIAILWMIAQVDEYGSFLYYGGLVLLSVLSAAVIAVLAHPGTRLSAWLGVKPLRWIGVRSYGLYIWHYPVIALSTPSVDTEGVSVLRIVIQLAVSFILAALSWKYIEEPIRRGALSRVWQRVRTIPAGKRRVVWLAAICPIVLLAISCNNGAGHSVTTAKASTGTAVQDSVLRPGSSSGLTQTGKSDGAKNAAGHNRPNTQGTMDPIKDKPIKETSVGNGQKGTIPPKEAKPEDEAGKGITAIGDSVILDAQPFLEKLLPGIVVDGKIGRQMSQATDVVESLKAGGKLGDCIIIELGTNGSFNSKQLRKLLDSLSDAKEIWLVNTRVPRKWQDTVNAALEKAAGDYDNVKLIDWFSASKGKISFFYKDGVHLKPSGADYYAKLLKKELGVRK
ncbi:acetyltransferase [Cohnella terricola]|uniref:Acetyltransferase n=2 Tax=Cohnella terricola TaxID=1289167 RepID=A0A559JR63_9BACL|nr:acetyltransferase [Cohnella terricola]